jgi:EF-P beta-lysylation protein EpmB
MIPRIPGPEHSATWQLELARAVRSTDELLRLLDIDPAVCRTRPLVGDFPLRVPRGFVARMARGDINDPLLRQVLPVEDECRQVAGFATDPLQEHAAMPVSGLLHKYRGRALLTVTGACAVHCRYCFRRHFPYADTCLSDARLTQAIDYLAQRPEIHEIILSGGDPLSLTDQRLAVLSDRLSALPQLRILRLHTRAPVVLPERIDDGLLAWIEGLRLRVVVVVHCNHPNEVDDSVAAAMQRFAQAGVTLLNQSVLLRGINDDPTTLIRLSETLFAAGILPYYLHRLDRVQGAAHFEVDTARACALHREVHAALPGYLVPRLVAEIPDAAGKTALCGA